MHCSPGAAVDSAQRFGYFTALKIGFGIMAGALAVGSQLQSVPGQIAVMAAVVAGMCFTWPTLEALVSEGESRAGLQQMVGVYNTIWAGPARWPTSPVAPCWTGSVCAASFLCR